MIYPESEQSSDVVAQHYNELDQFYRQLWGEHLHHGYWKIGNETVDQAAEQLIDLVAKAGQIDDHCRVLEVGCGYGATARYLANKIEATVLAFTSSKSQWQYARSNDPESSNPRYILGDFLHNDFKDASFDVIISIESTEHMVDKPAVFKEVQSLLKPGGRFVTCGWLSKTNPSSWEVKNLLEPICREGRLPSLGSEEDYRRMMQEAGLNVVDFSDISDSVKKTWSICIYRMIKALIGDKTFRQYILNKDSKERTFVKALFHVWAAYGKKALRYGLFTAKKE